MPKGQYKRTPEIRNKMRIANLGFRPTEETRKKLSLATSGKNNPRWIEDRTKLKKADDRRTTAYMDWAKSIKNRDGWRCRLKNNECSEKLQAHHIFNWTDHPELRYIINNGITLCKVHHPLKWDEEKRMIPIFQELILMDKYKLAGETPEQEG